MAAGMSREPRRGGARGAATDPSDYRRRVYAYYLRTHGAGAPANAATALAPRAAYLKRLVRRHFPADRAASILDLGCGHGALLHAARLAGYHNLAGVDTSPEQVAAARQLGIADVREGDVLDTVRSLPDESHDLVVTFDVVEHLRREELLPLADEVLRVLRPAARWILHTPNAASPFFGRIRYGDITHELAFTPASLGQVLLTCGFSRFECFEDAPVVHGAKSAVRLAAWKLIRGALRLYVAVETGDTGRGAVFSQNFLTVATK
jgi:SAM-dependent methyltransferase